MANFGHDSPGQSIYQGSDLATIQVNNGFNEDDNEGDLDIHRLDQELKIELNELFNESGAEMSVLSSSNQYSDDSGGDLESSISHSQSVHKSKKERVPVTSELTSEHLNYVNTNFQPDFFHNDGSYPSPILQYNPQLKSDKQVISNEAAQNITKQYVYEGMSNEGKYENLQTLNEMRRSEVIRLEKELSELKMQASVEIGNLRQKLLINESEGQRKIIEYQQQCENLKEKTKHLEEENLVWKHKVELAEKSNSKSTKELENNRINMRNLEEQLTNLSRNGSKQYDTNVDFLINDLKKKHNQEVTSLQEQYKSLLEQIKSKDRHIILLTNELKKLTQEHDLFKMENDNVISNLKKELNMIQKREVSNSDNYNEVVNLKSQLLECSKQNQELNSILQKLTTENEKLRSNLSASRVSIDKHGTNDSNLGEDYQKSLEMLQKQRDDVKQLQEMLCIKDRSIAEMEKKEITYEHCMRQIQLKLKKYFHEKDHIGEHSNHDFEKLLNALEMQLEDTTCKLIRTQEDMSTLSKQDIKKDKLINHSSVEEYMHYHQSSLENVTKQKDEEIEKLKNRMEEYIKEIDELKQLYVKVCSEKENSLNEKEKLEKRFDELSAQFETLDKQYNTVVKEKEELAIALIGMKKEISDNQDSLQKQLLEKEIEDLKNELTVHKCQKEMISQLKINLTQSKDRVLSLEQRLQSECNSKVATYVDQFEHLKKQYDEKVEELKNAKDTIFKLTNSDFQMSTEEKTLRSKLSDYENSLANIEMKHKLAMNEMTFKFKNELREMEMLYNKKYNEERVICAKMIEELKTKHKIEIDTLNTVAKQNASDYASQELIQIVADHKQQFEKAKEIVTLKNNVIKELEMKLENAKMEISIKNNQFEQLKEMHTSSADIDKLSEQIEEERSKFTKILSAWTQEMHQIKNKLSTTMAECEKFQTKYTKAKHAALNYKRANQKQKLICIELIANCVHFIDKLKIQSDELIINKEKGFQLSLKEFENECKQRRLMLNSDE